MGCDIQTLRRSAIRGERESETASTSYRSSTMTPPDLSKFQRQSRAGYVWLHLPVHLSFGDDQPQWNDFRAASIARCAGVQPSGPFRRPTWEDVLSWIRDNLGALEWSHTVCPDGTEYARFLLRRPARWDRALRKVLSDAIVDRMIDTTLPAAARATETQTQTPIW